MALEKVFKCVFPEKHRRRRVELLSRLIAVAEGAEKADAVLRNATLVDVFLGETVKGVSIAIASGFVVAVTDSEKDNVYIGPRTRVYDARNRFVLPAFIDAHVHIESTFLTPKGFAEIAIPHGVAAAVADPHEVANVGGKEYVKRFAEMCLSTPMKIMVQIPCCVPPVKRDDIDVYNGVISYSDVVELLETGLFHSIGEFMDYPSILRRDENSLNIVSMALERNIIVYGHIPSKNIYMLNAYSVAGPSSCHESIDVDEAVEKLRRGIWVMLRYGSTWRDAEHIIPKLIKRGYKLDRVILVSDDTTSTFIIEKGYMDYALKEMIRLGVEPLDAIRMVTLNPSTYLRIDDVYGSVAPGRVADIVMVEDIKEFHVETVFVDGEPVYVDGKLMINRSSDDSQQNSLPSPMNVPNIVSWRDMAISVPRGSEAEVLVAEIIHGSPVTRKSRALLKIVDGVVKPDTEADVLPICVVDRYRGRDIGKGFVKGLKLVSGAIAQTIAHDTHNIVVVGANYIDMLKAFSILREIGGGIVAVDRDYVCRVRLDVAGLMGSDREYVYKGLKCIEKFIESRTGLEPYSLIHHISLIPLPVIPEIRVTPKGVVDVDKLSVVNPVLSIY